MNINTSYNNNTNQIGRGSDEASGANNLLEQLANRVDQTLGQKNNPLGDGGQMAAAQKINPQDVTNYMSNISGQQLPGVNFNSLV
ncbi:hypothetical protein HZB07_01910 [Candidatus Saganbacteria bacterium]|nr:hypothetical protein [Candidatus Saganbacteria bacterium]